MLIASSVYRSFDVDVVTVLFIKHLALADLFFHITITIPWVITALAKRWVLGSLLCYIQATVIWLPLGANIGFLLAVSAHRLGRCVAPMTLSCLTRRRASQIVSLIWIVATVPSCVTFLKYIIKYLEKGSLNDVTFGSGSIHCIPKKLFTRTKIGNGAFWEYGDVFIWTTAASLVGLNVAILIQSRKSTHKLSLVAIRTVCLVCCVFLIGVSPVLCRVILDYLYNDPTFPYRFTQLRIRTYLLTFATICNPILYTFTNVKFRKFVVKKIKVILCQMYHQDSKPLALNVIVTHNIPVDITFPIPLQSYFVKGDTLSDEITDEQGSGACVGDIGIDYSNIQTRMGLEDIAENPTSLDDNSDNYEIVISISPDFIIFVNSDNHNETVDSDINNVNDDDIPVYNLNDNDCYTQSQTLSEETRVSVNNLNSQSRNDVDSMQSETIRGSIQTHQPKRTRV